MTDKVKKVNGFVNLKLTLVEANWLYEVLQETFDKGSATELDELHAVILAERIDREVYK